MGKIHFQPHIDSTAKNNRSKWHEHEDDCGIALTDRELTQIWLKPSMLKESKLMSFGVEC